MRVVSVGAFCRGFGKGERRRQAVIVHAANSFLIRKTVPTPVFRSLAIRRTPRLAANAFLMAATLPHRYPLAAGGLD
jgi:hypothetical protein